MADQRKYLRIPNWEQLQYRSDRVLPWLKLPVSLLDHDEWIALSEAQKGGLTSLWMLAQTKQNRIAYDTAWLKGRINIDARTVRALIEQGLIEVFAEVLESKGFSDLAQKMGAQSAPLEGEGEGEGDINIRGIVDSSKANGSAMKEPSQPRIDIPNLAPPRSPNGRNCDFDELKRKVKTAWQVEAQRDPDSIARNTGFSIKQVRAALNQLRDDGELR